MTEPIEDDVELLGDEDSNESELEDDDYDLIEENLGVKVQRRKFKRLRRISDDSDEDVGQGGDDREAIAQQLFEGSDNEEDKPESIDEENRDHYSSGSEDDYSDADDFIVDDQGQPINENRYNRKRKRHVPDAVVQDAQDIFGIGFDYEEFERFGEHDDQDDQGSDYEDETDQQMRSRKKSRRTRSIYEIYEPHALERAGYTAEDVQIRTKDVPERLQMRSVPVKEAKEEELQEEAEWVYKKAKFVGVKRFIGLQPAEPSEANWGQDWDSRTIAPGAAVTDPSGRIPPPPPTNANWDDDWDRQTTAPTGPSTTNAPGPTSARVPPPPQSNANWEDDWETPTAGPTGASRQNSGITSAANVDPKNTNGIPASAGSVVDDTGWSDDWDKGTTVGAAAGGTDFVDWKRPAIPPPPNRKATNPTAGGDATVDDSWTEESWETSTTVPNAANQEIPGPSLSSTESVPIIVSAPPVDNNESKTVPKIRNTLELIRNQHFEIPFIAFYRKECVLPELSLGDLWKIYRLDAQFCELKSRKEALWKLFNNMKDYLAERWSQQEGAEADMEDVKFISDQHVDRVLEIKTVDELKDMGIYFRVHYGDSVYDMKSFFKQKEREQRLRDSGQDVDLIEDVDTTEGKKSIYNFKRKSGAGGAYAKCVRLDFVSAFMPKIGITSEKFAENLRDKYQRHEVEPWPVSPVEVAVEIIAGKSLRSKPEHILETARFILSVQIANEPIVRQCVRKEFFERATVSCWPSKKGLQDVDESHPCYTMKYLKDKPVKRLEEDQFLKLTIAEKDGLLNTSLGDTFNYFDEIKHLITRDEFSKTAQEWNELREQCLKLALENRILPGLRKELREKLLEDCYEYILERCGTKLYHWLKVAPMKVYFPDENEIEWDTSQGIRVLSVAYDPVIDPCGAMIGVVRPDGEPDIRSFRHDEDPSDRLQLKNILQRKSNEEKDEDIGILKDYIREMKPHLIIIAGESRDAIRLQQDIDQIVTELVNEDAFPKIGVEIMDNQAAKVYASSKRSISDLGSDYPTLLRQAISLGRRAQDPLLELAQLWNADEDILCLKLHPLQEQVPKERLLERLETEFINRTCEVGVDINRALSFPHTASVVQFVCGLGPRKASALLQTLRQKHERKLENRSQLLTNEVIGRKVFLNCSGFIRIDASTVGDMTDSYVEVLDSTRVHPECYEYARRMAVDALHDPDEPDPLETAAVEEIMEDPDPVKLNELELEAFAATLKEQGSGDKLQTLFDIREELKGKYRDMRLDYVPPEPHELFNMLTKETPETLSVGKLVTATVGGVVRKKPKDDEEQVAPIKNSITGKWQCSFCGKNEFPELGDVWAHLDDESCPGPAVGVRIYLDNGLSGFIPTSKLSDKPVFNPEERVYIGQNIHCRIAKILVDRFSVDCTSRTSDLLDAKHEWRPTRDPYYDHERETFELGKAKEEEERKQAQKQRKVYFKRVIVHPSFRNVSFHEAEKLLESMDQGEVVVRPSSKGPDHLTVTWKVADGISQHLDVREEGKANTFALGQSLWIGKDEFEDIDEIIARYVAPMASHARDIISYRYFVADLGGSREKAEEYLVQQKQKNNNKIHYCFQSNKEFPGKFMLSYLPRNSAVHEFVTVTSEGFRFRQQLFENLNELLKWFKTHFKEAPPSGTPIVAGSNRSGVTTQRAGEGCQFTGYQTNQGRPNEGGITTGRCIPHPPQTQRTTPHYSTPLEPFTPYAVLRTSIYDGPKTPAVTPRVVETPGSKATPQGPVSHRVDDDECWE